MTVVRTLARNRNRTMTTKIPPSNNDFCTLPMELSMKRLCLKMSVLTFTSGGRFFCRSFREVSNLSVSSRVLVAGCLVTVSSTAGFPRSEAVPSFGSLAPMRTSAMSSSRTGTPGVEAGEADEVSPSCSLTAVLASCSTRSVEITPRTMYSFPYS